MRLHGVGRGVGRAESQPVLAGHRRNDTMTPQRLRDSVATPRRLRVLLIAIKCVLGFMPLLQCFLPEACDTAVSIAESSRSHDVRFCTVSATPSRPRESANPFVLLMRCYADGCAILCNGSDPEQRALAFCRECTTQLRAEVLR